MEVAPADHWSGKEEGEWRRVCLLEAKGGGPRKGKETDEYERRERMVPREFPRFFIA